MIKRFIKAIKEEKLGFHFDQPWCLEENSVMVIIPVLRKGRRGRDYITLSEARKIEIKDTGSIDGIYVKNNGKKPVLISRGDIFKGETQERAAVHDYIIMPGRGLKVAVRCVHASKGIVGGSEMRYVGKTPYDIDLSNQIRTWNTISCFTGRVEEGSSTTCHVNCLNSTDFTSVNYSGFTGTGITDVSSNLIIRCNDDLVSTLDDLTDSIKDVMKKIPYIKNQVGAIFVRKNEIIGMDVYDVPKSWDAIKKDIIKKEGKSFVKKDEDDLFEFRLNPKKAKPFLRKKLSVPFDEKVLYDGEYRIVELKSDTLCGEGIIFRSKVIHLTLWKKN
ncbi:MAG: ARPP-1 family domain-containing protein [Candidatus Heimdallarchaeaceae archaeon]